MFVVLEMLQSNNGDYYGEKLEPRTGPKLMDIMPSSKIEWLRKSKIQWMLSLGSGTCCAVFVRGALVTLRQHPSSDIAIICTNKSQAQALAFKRPVIVSGQTVAAGLYKVESGLLVPKDLSVL